MTFQKIKHSNVFSKQKKKVRMQLSHNYKALFSLRNAFSIVDCYLKLQILFFLDRYHEFVIKSHGKYERTT